MPLLTELAGVSKTGVAIHMALLTELLVSHHSISRHSEPRVAAPSVLQLHATLPGSDSHA
jgi:hypothetical protein